MKSVWRDSCIFPERSPLEGDLSADAVVVGAGMAGILTAYLLSEKGLSVAVLERAETAGGVTENTTAKITSQHDLIYDSLISGLGEEKARQYAEANQTAIEKFAQIVSQNHIDCDFERRAAYVYTLDNEKRIEREAEAAEKLGISSAFTKDTSLPFEVKGAVRFDNQAQFNPLKFLKPIAEKLDIYEHTMVREIKDGAAVTDRGKVKAKAVVVATHFPFINVPGYYFMRMHQERSYVIALENAAELDGMYIDADEDGYSFRNYQNLLLLGGGSHRTGKNKKGGYYEKLEKQAKKWYPDAVEKFRWSAQDCITLDNIPYIGRYSEKTPSLFVATGFKKWGMTSAMVSAMILSDMITGKDGDYSGVFSPQRFHPAMSAANLVSDGAQSISGLAAGNLKIPEGHLKNLAKGHGGVVEYDGKKIGAYRDEEGTVFAVSTKCPHLGCELQWNPDEKSWDCPCHGSRFDCRGRLIDNPAMKGIALNE